jgi:hypothetical protein
VSPARSAPATARRGTAVYIEREIVSEKARARAREGECAAGAPLYVYFNVMVRCIARPDYECIIKLRYKYILRLRYKCILRLRDKYIFKGSL